jgi:uncharacterized membrane protein YccC
MMSIRSFTAWALFPVFASSSRAPDLGHVHAGAVLGVAGGLLGLLVALWVVETLIQLAPANCIPRCS